jgi:hypothetical protein
MQSKRSNTEKSRKTRDLLSWKTTLYETDKRKMGGQGHVDAKGHYSNSSKLLIKITFLW